MRVPQLSLALGLVLLLAAAVPGGSVDNEHVQQAGHLQQHVLQLELEAADRQRSELRRTAQTALVAADSGESARASTFAEAAANAKTALRRNMLRLDSAIGILDQDKPVPKKTASNSTTPKKTERKKDKAAAAAATTTAAPSSDAKQEEDVEAAREKDAAIEAKLKKERRQKRIQSQYRKCKSGCEELESQVFFVVRTFM